MGCVPLLPRRLLIFVENPVDEFLHRTQFRLLPLGSFALRRNCVFQCLTHYAPVHLMLFGQLANRLSCRVTAADHLEQLQFGSPFHLRQDGKSPSLGLSRVGPNQTIKWGQIRASNSRSEEHTSELQSLR